MIDKLKQYLESCHRDIHFNEEFYDEIAVIAGATFYITINMSSDEKEMFKDELKRAVFNHKYGSLDIRKIVNACEKKLSAKKIARLTNSTLINDSLRFVEPYKFIKNYKELINRAKSVQ